MRGIKFLFQDGGRFYDVEIALVRVYRHKDQDFKTLRKLETVFGQLNKLQSDSDPLGKKSWRVSCFP